MEGNVLEALNVVLYEPFKKAIHRRRKYDVFCSIGLLQTVMPHDTRSLSHYIRHTDKAMVVTPNTSVIFYDYTDIDRAKFAFNNLINTFIHHNDDFVVAYTQIYDTDREPEVICRRLYEILAEAKREKIQMMDDSRIMQQHGTYEIDFSDILSG